MASYFLKIGIGFGQSPKRWPHAWPKKAQRHPAQWNDGLSPCLRQSDETGHWRTLWRTTQNEPSWLSAATHAKLMATQAQLRRAGGGSLLEARNGQRTQTEPHRMRQGCLLAVLCQKTLLLTCLPFREAYARRACIESNEVRYGKRFIPLMGDGGGGPKPGGTFAICRIIGNVMFGRLYRLNITLIMRGALFSDRNIALQKA